MKASVFTCIRALLCHWCLGFMGLRSECCLVVKHWDGLPQY